MTLEEYIREQEKKAIDRGQEIQSSAKEAWKDTKEAGRRAAERVSDSLNG